MSGGVLKKSASVSNAISGTDVWATSEDPTARSTAAMTAVRVRVITVS